MHQRTDGLRFCASPDKKHSKWLTPAQHKSLYADWIDLTDDSIAEIVEFFAPDQPEQFLNSLPNPPMEKHQIQARLIENGSNFRQFAISHGYEPRTVTQVVKRWAGHDKYPQGRLSFRILQDLSRMIGKEVVPGILTESNNFSSMNCADAQ